MAATASEYYVALTALLTENGFEWVTQQVQSQIDQGKPLVKSVASAPTAELTPDVTVSVDDFNTTPRRRRQRASLLTSEPYTEVERLRILLTGIRAALVERSRLETAIGELVGGFKSVSFEPDQSLFEWAPAEVVRREHRVEMRQFERRSFAGNVETILEKILSDIDGGQ